MSFDFDVAIAGSVPLIHDFDDVDPTLAPIKTSRRRWEIRVMFNLNTHALIHGMRGRDSVLALTMSNVVHSSAVYRLHLCCDPARKRRQDSASLVASRRLLLGRTFAWQTGQRQIGHDARARPAGIDDRLVGATEHALHGLEIDPLPRHVGSFLVLLVDL